jgi:predicted nucleic acid-binding protein
VTVLDTSGAIDFLLGDGAAREVEAMLWEETMVAAPDIMVFEVLAILRRDTLSGAIESRRARAAIVDLRDLGVELFPSLGLCERAWELRDDLTAADALFVSLAEQLGEPLATKDRGLAAAARRLTGIETIELPAAGGRS